jgi:hypothetical protein
VKRPRPAKNSNRTAAAERRVLPMELQVGDRFVDETGEWEVIGRPRRSAARPLTFAFRGPDSPTLPRSERTARTSASA